jgi:predicted  nucleic acid-binding Zn-ribbon protein
MKVSIPVSVGELLDKISILEIKSMFSDSEYIQKELKELNQIKSTITQYTLEYEIELKKVNQKLWNIEDKIREKEKLQQFDDEFIELARGVYITNDKRAEIKRKINEVTNSSYRENKLYGE